MDWRGPTHYTKMASSDVRDSATSFSMPFQTREAVWTRAWRRGWPGVLPGAMGPRTEWPSERSKLGSRKALVAQEEDSLGRLIGNL